MAVYSNILQIKRTGFTSRAIVTIKTADFKNLKTVGEP
jgi:hypothetical protein